MAVVTVPSIYIFDTFLTTGVVPVPGGVVYNWKHRLAGTAYVEANPMVGTVLALLPGPYTVLGLTTVNPDGTWEITGISREYEGKELLVLGIPNDPTVNYATASRIKTVN